MRELLNIIHADDMSELVKQKPSSIYALWRWNFNSIKWDEIQEKTANHIREVVAEYKLKFKD